MNPKLERLVYIGIIVVLAGYLLHLGKVKVELEKQIPITIDELYEMLGNSKLTVQIIDVRPYEAEDEDEEDEEELNYYTEAHIPGAIPFPDCDETKTPEDALPNINPYLPTIIVSKDGDPEIFQKCAEKFPFARNLKGGILAWDEEGYPEDEGEYEPPSAGGGGGCL
ncbi:MAG: rhodanese-like domain-containing protein [Aquificae bacterium]|jgi:3-mercaptopyruvate sulfurtransferase SseA|nr:rhodanese-like domain-containing protein [Aquificota bacterium]